MLHFLHIFAAASACEWIRSCHVCECATVSILCFFFELPLTLTLPNAGIWIYEYVCVCTRVSLCELHYWKLVRFYAQKRLLGCCYVFNYPHFEFFCCCRLPAACFGSRFVAACCCCLPAAAGAADAVSVANAATASIGITSLGTLICVVDQQQHEPLFLMPLTGHISPLSV